MTKIQKQVIKANSDLTEQELFNWSMNQLFRAARTLALLVKPENNMIGQGCDCTAICILKRLVKTRAGYDQVKRFNRKLVRGYKRPTE